MKYTSSADLRNKFLNYFAKQGHTIVPSSPLVPANDPTLLFTNAGMVQFKEIFLGLEQPPYARATTAQRCMRAGGKHNDLDNVGYTARHHTFFEMLGNFSFGNYFKREAIHYAWEFLTKVLEIPAEKLWVTIFKEDEEAAAIWLNEVKVDPSRFSRCGEADNFWMMGDTGPCGPCSEIFYDHGPAIAGGPPGSPNQDGDRYVEIWNLVFMQYQRFANGTLRDLPAPSVDTGMGLERLAAVMQGVHNNYDTDLFTYLIRAIADLAHVKDLTHTSLRVIADHMRACAFLITDGVMPNNEGRGYVLRRIIRRALRHGQKLGLGQTPFFYQLAQPFVKEMQLAYPELSSALPRIEEVLQQEENQFCKTLEQGLRILAQDITKLTGKIIPGSTVFKLYDTYGFPLDLTADIAREQGLEIDQDGFETEMAKQRANSQAGNRFNVDYSQQTALTTKTDFIGYEALNQTTRVVDLRYQGEPVTQLLPGQEGVVILATTPFYAESGGQVGDQGLLHFTEGFFTVTNTQKEQQAHLHYGTLAEGTLRVGTKVQAEVNAAKRLATALNHTATHLLHAALRTVLDNRVIQKGSLVEPERLRFDFCYFKELSSAQILAIEYLVNEQIRANYPVETTVMPIQQAKAEGAVALFGEKYSETVRVLTMGEFSKELCGGTHAKRTGDIGLFKITAASGIAAGIRRIEAVTGAAALAYQDNFEYLAKQAAQLLSTYPDVLLNRIRQITQHNYDLQKQVDHLQNQVAQNTSLELATQAIEIAGIKVLTAEIAHTEINALRTLMDQLKQKLKTAAIVLATVNEGKVNLLAGVTKDCTERLSASNLVNYVAMQVGGKGGGRPDMAQAGGSNPRVLTAALQSVPAWITQQLAQNS